MKAEPILGCAYCGRQPKLLIKKGLKAHDGHDRRWFSFLCGNSECVGHNGRFYMHPASGLRAWNAGQKIKKGVINNSIKMRGRQGV